VDGKRNDIFSHLQYETMEKVVSKVFYMQLTKKSLVAIMKHLPENQRDLSRLTSPLDLARVVEKQGPLLLPLG
jgi:hypothetical protein